MEFRRWWDTGIQWDKVQRGHIYNHLSTTDPLKYDIAFQTLMSGKTPCMITALCGIRLSGLGQIRNYADRANLHGLGFQSA